MLKVNKIYEAWLQINFFKTVALGSHTQSIVSTCENRAGSLKLTQLSFNPPQTVACS